MIRGIDTYGIELIHLRRKGLSNQRWIVGGKRCLLLDYLGPIIDEACVNVYDSVKEEMVVLANQGVAKVDRHPINLRLCQRGQWSEPMLVATV